MDRELRTVIKREGQLNLLSYIIILVLIAITGLLVFMQLAGIAIPDLWLLKNEIFRTVATGLMLMVILYMVDQHNRLRKELVAIHDDLESAQAELQTAYDRLAFAHRTAEIMASHTHQSGIEQVLRESISYFGADAAAIVGDDVNMVSQDGVSHEEAQQAVMRVSLEAVRAGKPLLSESSDDGSAALAVPLRVKGKLDQVACLWRHEGTFSAEALEGLLLVARILEMSLENRVLLEEVREQLQGTLMALSNLVELRQPDYMNHSSKVADYAVSVGVAMGLTQSDIADLRLSAVLHDVGMLEVPLEIITANRPLTAEETMTVRRHPVSGARIVKTARFDDQVQQAVLAHHERLDGSGYPNGLRGDRIPLLARIIAVCDAYNAMTHKRPHRPAMTPEAAMSELLSGAGWSFDPQVVHALQHVTGCSPQASGVHVTAGDAALLSQVS
ncbi:MAG: HD domain-containing phosphohydrolase [Actinomycetota bacterium]|nr:MAG: metal dependent [Actinomycetota bacterium]MDO8950035.1 HD domain-containing phosphohydrolase [Actinomycetota bacterium]MDP3629615.1 HD domain-containing phosphohydrolase [Actinomycetota bacterium]